MKKGFYWLFSVLEKIIIQYDSNNTLTLLQDEVETTSERFADK